VSSLTAEQQALCDAEARARVRRALDKIEAAQYLMSDAYAILSSLQYAAPEWKSTGAMHDRIKAHWYRVRDGLEFSAKARKVRLDPMAVESVLARADRAAA